jgi:D-glycero-D-manno-heptose 1,7-bisphosphate phosphatase
LDALSAPALSEGDFHGSVSFAVATRRSYPHHHPAGDLLALTGWGSINLKLVDSRKAMPLFLLDRDGVVVVNRPTNIKTPADLQLIEGAAEAIARLSEAGFHVAICTTQPEVARGAMTLQQLEEVHDALRKMLAGRGARIDLILCCTTTSKSFRRKPACGMLAEALTRYGAAPTATAFVGDQAEDLQAAFHAGCRRVLVRTGLGRKTLEQGLPQYVEPVAVYDDLAAAVDAELAAGHAR